MTRVSSVFKRVERERERGGELHCAVMNRALMPLFMKPNCEAWQGNRGLLARR